MANTGQENPSLIWRYFTLLKYPDIPDIKCNFCDVVCKSYDILTVDTCFLKLHLEQHHSHIIEEIKREIKSTWLSRYFVFDIKCESITCIFCGQNLRILDGINLQNHMLLHNIHEHTINYLKDDKTMVQNLPREIYVKIIGKLRDEIIISGLSSYFIFGGKHKYTEMKCAICHWPFNILVDKQILMAHLLYHLNGK